MINISKLYCSKSGQSDELRYSADDSSGPVAVFNCTNRCNLNCVHCYSGSSATETSDELTTAQVKKLLAGLADVKSPVVLFSGGEPLLREDLFELLSEANNRGLRTVLSTNGTLISSDIAKRLAEKSVSYIGISIDGNESFHDSFRKSGGSFEAALAGIKNCTTAGIRTGLRFTITKQNANYVPFIFELASKEGIRRICFYHLVRCGRASSLDGQTPSTLQSRKIVDAIIEKTAEYVDRGLLDEVLTVGNHCDGPFLLLRMQKEAENLKLKTQNYKKAEELLRINGGNRIGEKIVCISWDGNVYPDQFWRNYSLGNIREKTFPEIWNNSSEPVLNKLRNKSKFADKRCLTCCWFDFCKGNYRFLGPDPAEKNWLLEPACYLADDEIKK